MLLAAVRRRLPSLFALAFIAERTVADESPAPQQSTEAKSADLGSDIQTSAQRNIAAGPFEPTWQSLEQGYQCPDWFRDAKFGIWAHWTAQCVPEQGDWYARKMYLQGDPDYKFHVEHYGHPSKFGFKDIDNLWHAENWDPEQADAAV